jgi:hypothetical protein
LKCGTEAGSGMVSSACGVQEIEQSLHLVIERVGGDGGD